MDKTLFENVDFKGVVDDAEQGCSKTMDDQRENTEVTEEENENSLPSKKVSKKSKKVTSEKLNRFRALELRLNQLQEMQQQLMKSRKRCNVVVESSESENEPLPSHTDSEEVPPKVLKVSNIDVSGMKKAFKRIPKMKLPIIQESEFEDDAGVDDRGQHSTAISLQQGTANTRQQRTANSPQQRTAISQQQRTATMSHQVPSVSLGNSNIYDRVTLLPSDDNLEVSDEEDHVDMPPVQVSNVEGSLYNNLDLPYNAGAQGEQLDPRFADILTNVWKRKYTYNQMKPIWEKYPPPENLSSTVLAPELDIEVQNLMRKWQIKQDNILKGMQRSLANCVFATLKLNSFVQNDTANQNKLESAQISVDVTQMLSQVSRELSIKRRSFTRSHIGAEYKHLCDSTKEITTSLFGDNLSEDVKQINVSKQIADRAFNRGPFLAKGRGRGSSRAPHQAFHHTSNQHSQGNSNNNSNNFGRGGFNRRKPYYKK